MHKAKLLHVSPAFAIAINVAAESTDCNEYYYCDVGAGGYALLTRISIKVFAKCIVTVINKCIKHSSSSKFLPHNQYDGTKSSALRFIATAFELEPTFGGFISGGRRKQNRFAALWDSRKEAGNSIKTFLGSSPKTKHSLIFGANLRKVLIRNRLISANINDLLKF